MSSKPQPPDGGWGWVIVFCGFVNHVFTVGMMLSISVFYVSWLDQFEESKAATSWIMSIGVACMFGLCPIPASLAVRFGFRIVAFIGGLLTSFGLILSVFATSVTYLVVSIGLMTGIGCCFSFLPALATVTMYFDRRRSLAMGLNTAGTGIGAFALAPLLNHLEEMYGWRGAILILGAITLHMCVTGMLMRDLEVKTEVEVIEYHFESDMEKQQNEASEGFDVATAPMIDFGHANENNIGDRVSSQDPKSHSVSEWMENSSVNKNNYVDTDIEKHDFEIDESVTNPLIHQRGDSKGHNLHTCHGDMGKKMFPVNKEHNSCSFHSLDTQSSERSGAGLDHHSDISMNKDTAGVPQDLDKSSRKRSLVLTILRSDSIQRNHKLFSEKAHIAFCFSNFLTNLSYIAPVVFMVDRAVSQGISKSAGAILVSINGIGNVAGRLIFGYMADRFRTKRIYMYVIGLIVCGVGTMLSDLCGSNVGLHAVYATFVGFLMGTYTVLAPLVSVDLVGAAVFATAYGQTLFCMGLATIIGPPLAGWLFDWSESYLLSYLNIGLFFALSGVMLFPLLCRNNKTPSATTQEISRIEATLINN